ncbi:MAG: hypothetical protein ABIG67_05835 [Pseudomonadota bacterium]
MAYRHIYRNKDVSVGMWPGSKEVVFTHDNIKPEDVDCMDYEHELTISDLEGIVRSAKLYSLESDVEPNLPEDNWREG